MSDTTPATPATFAPASVWVTAESGKRVEYAHVPNGDPSRVAHFIAAAGKISTYTDVSTNEGPTCVNTGCTRECTYDSEPGFSGEGSYFSTCDRCGTYNGAGLHAHIHRYSAAQCAADSRRDPEHTWSTSTVLRPVITDDVVTAWECRESLPDGRGACGYVISAADMDAHRAFRRGELFLCQTALSASNGHGIGRDTNGPEVWAAFTQMREAWNAAHPSDLR